MSFIDELNKAIAKENSVVIDGKEYIFDNFGVEKLKKVDTEVTEGYIKSLINYLGAKDPNRSPVYINYLLRYDYYNKMFFNSNGDTYICQYDYDGNLIKEFNSLEELMELSSTKGFLFTLKNKNNSDFVPKKGKVEFFGTQITPMYTEKSWRYSFVSFLNVWMKGFVELGNKEKRSKDYYENSSCEAIKNYYSLDEYLIKSKMSFLFSLGETLHFGFFQRSMNKERKETLSKEEYDEQLNKLLDRYTYKNTRLFQKVENLNGFVSQNGIYILCLPEVKGYYVGKATKSLKRRIVNHWTNPNSDFDKTFGPSDVKEIYVLNCSESYDAEYYINSIERDCIATIGRKFSLNVMVGGNTIDTIHDKGYDEKKYQISNKEMEFITSILFSAYEKQKQKQKIQSDFFAVKENKAVYYEQYLNAVKYDYNSLFCVPIEMRNSELCLQAIYYHHYGNSCSFLNNSPKYVREFLSLIPSTSYSNEFVRQLIIELTGNGFTKLLFEFLPLESISFENLIFLVDCDINSLDLIPSKYRTQELYNQISKLNGKLYTKIPSEFLSKEVYMNLVIAMPSNIKKVPKTLLDRDFYVSVIKGNSDVLKYVPKDTVDEEIIELALLTDSSAIRFVDPNNLNYPKYALNAVKEDWKVLKYIPDEYKTEEMRAIVLPFGKRPLKYFPKNIK